MAYRIRLEYEREVIAEIDSDALDQEVIVGRSSECTWVTPADDAAVGRQHVKIYRRGRRTVMLEDMGSRNGSFLNGKQIRKPLRLRPGQRIIIGKSVIDVSMSVTDTSRPLFKPFLVVRSGSRKGLRLAVAPKGVRIGSDPQSELVLLDDLMVSRNHAFVGYSESGSCWVEDRGSMNGTRVDGERLVKERKRPLKPGNIIQVAHVDVLYTDEAVLAKRGRLWRSLAVAAASLAIIYGIYYANQWVGKDDAETILADSRELAANERFIEARERLDQATAARGYRGVRDRVEQLYSQLGRWQETSGRWRRAEAVLRDPDVWQTMETSLQSPSLRRLADDLSQLSTSVSRADWEWHAERSALYARQADTAKRVIDRVFAVAAMSRDPALDPVRLADEISNLDQALQRAERDEASVDLLEGVSRLAREVRQQAALILNAIKRIETVLGQIETDWPPPLESAIRDFEEIADSGQPAAVQRVQALIPVLRELHQSYAQMRMRMESARLMEFDAAIEPVQLPTRDVTRRHAATSALRARLENSSESIRRRVVQANSWHRQTTAALRPKGGVDGLIERWSTPEIVNDLLQYDCFDGPYPRRSRSEPVSFYDRILGIERFYARVRDPEHAGEPSEWEPEIFQLAVAFRTVHSAVNAFESQGMRWLIDQRMRKYVEDLRRVAALRESLTRELLEQAQKSSGRDAILLAGMALILVQDAEQTFLQDIPLREWIHDRMGTLRNELISLDREYPLAAAERQIEIREEVLRKGLPGDPLVRQYWLRRTY